MININKILHIIGISYISGQSCADCGGVNTPKSQDMTDRKSINAYT